MAKKRNQMRRKKKKKPYRRRDESIPKKLIDVEKLYNQGFEALEAGSYQAAEQHFKKSLDLVVTADACYALGSVYMYQDEYDQAMETFEQLVKLDKKNALYWYSLGCAALRVVYLSRAVLAFDQATRYCGAHDAELAESIATNVKLLNRAIELQLEEHPRLNRETYLEQEALYYRAIALQEENKIEEALALFIEYLKVEPDFYRALGNAGVCLMSLNRQDEAEMLLRKAVQINPDYEVARFNLNALKKQREKGIPAERVSTIVLDTTKGDDFDELLANELYKQGKRLIHSDEEDDLDVPVINERKTHRKRYQAQSTNKSR